MEHVASWVLIERCARVSEPGAWSAFVDRFGRRLAAGVSSAFRRAGFACPPEELDDVVQEVYCRLLRRGRAALRACRGREECEIDAYLFRLAQRVALDHLRARAATRRGGDVAHVANGDEATLEGLASREPSPEQRTMLAEQWRLLAARCRRREDAGDLDRRLLMWSLRDGLTSSEIARRLGGRIGPSGVDTRLHRLRSRLAAEGLRLPLRTAAL
ncbi:MAG: RNA polymerase sigma factor [Thermoanaerobaculia bacterium]